MSGPCVHFITHPEVVIDPLVPVPDWALSEVGIARMVRAWEQGWLARARSVYCSGERKAREAAALVAEPLGLVPVVIEALGENDRSATGYLPQREFEAVADVFFARPNESVRGWERAVDAQRRIVDAVERAIAAAPGAGDVAIVSHGGVGALLLCHLTGVPIGRAADQPGGGGGNVFCFDKATRRVRSGWRDIAATSTA